MDGKAHHVFKGKFRFQDLTIWQEAISMTSALFQIADTLEERKHFRFADQLRGVALGMPNNIAESSGTSMKGEQLQLLRYARRECFEAANMLIILEREGLVDQALTSQFFARLDLLSRSIQAYMKAIAREA
jgi:four helix bundle protein